MIAARLRYSTANAARRHADGRHAPVRRPCGVAGRHQRIAGRVRSAGEARDRGRERRRPPGYAGPHAANTRLADLQDPTGAYPETTAITETRERLYVQSLHAKGIGWLAR
jgi:hypothetical protein